MWSVADAAEFVRCHPRKAAQIVARVDRKPAPYPDEIDRARLLAAALRAADRCRVCGADLEDPVSRASGLGPTCAAKAEKAAS